MNPGLYVVGTPIGHLDDLSPRALAVLQAAQVVMAEDTRVTRKLFSRFGVHTRLVSCHRFNEAARAALVRERVAAGEVVALVTDSGMPGVSDPGARLVSDCRRAGCPVTVIPGPSAVTAAMALCGFESPGFIFDGFLPRKPGPRRRRLQLWAEAERPVVLYESPHRILALLADIEAVFTDRPVFLARELTKQFEESLSGTAAELRQALSLRAPRGEFVVVVGPAGRRSGEGASSLTPPEGQ